jgi:hypothetical protein
LIPPQLLNFANFPNDLRASCFEFFYWFSRFEFALKENAYIRKGPYGSAAPDWGRFEKDFADVYTAPDEGRELFRYPPQRQIFVPPSNYEWKITDLSDKTSDLGKVILILKTIRNNLFHGGKHDQKDWDDPRRNLFLLSHGINVLGSVAAVDAVIAADYKRTY